MEGEENFALLMLVLPVEGTIPCHEKRLKSANDPAKTPSSGSNVHRHISPCCINNERGLGDELVWNTYIDKKDREQEQVDA